MRLEPKSLVLLCWLAATAGTNLAGNARAADAPAPPEQGAPAFEEDPAEQGLWEDAKTKPESVTPPPDTSAAPPLPQRKLQFTMDAELDYFFYQTRNQITLTYTLSFDGLIDMPAPDTPQKNVSAWLKGTGGIITKVTGTLAKWAGGECQLLVKVPDTPYQFHYLEDAGKATMTMVGLGPTTEEWESHCSLSNDPEAAFNTTGPLEKWVGHALDKVKALINKVELQVSDAYDTEWPFQIEPISMEDEAMAGIELRAHGTIRIGPPRIESQ